ncbi:MAG: hypothetical protein ACPIOQ_01455 [Promethearchaeia archaeon]
MKTALVTCHEVYGAQRCFLDGACTSAEMPASAAGCVACPVVASRDMACMHEESMKRGTCGTARERATDPSIEESAQLTEEYERDSLME